MHTGTPWPSRLASRGLPVQARGGQGPPSRGSRDAESPRGPAVCREEETEPAQPPAASTPTRQRPRHVPGHRADTPSARRKGESGEKTRFVTRRLAATRVRHRAIARGSKHKTWWPGVCPRRTLPSRGERPTPVAPDDGPSAQSGERGAAHTCGSRCEGKEAATWRLPGPRGGEGSYRAGEDKRALEGRLSPRRSRVLMQTADRTRPPEGRPWLDTGGDCSVDGGGARATDSKDR